MQQIAPALGAGFVLLVIMMNPAAESQAQDLPGDHPAFMTKSGHAEFHSEVPTHTFSGTSDRLVGKITLPDSTVDFYLDLTTLDTGIDKRDRDMRETLNTEEYPFASFYGKLITPFNPDTTTEQGIRVRGTFSIHGVERKVTIDGTMQMTPDGLKVQAGWTLNLEDYDIRPPGILFYRVDEKQDIKIDALLKPVESSKSN